MFDEMEKKKKSYIDKLNHFSLKQEIAGKFFSRFLRYGLLRRLKGGIRLTIVITYKCNLHCDYCSLKLAHREMPSLQYKDMTSEKLKGIIDEFPLKISGIALTGGEPALNKDLPEIVNWLLDQGICVTIYSNLVKIKPYFLIQQSYKFRIVSTYHISCDKKKFIENYYKLKKYYRVDVDEIGTKTLPFSRLKKFIVINDSRIPAKNYLRIGIDGLIFTNCYDVIDHYTR